MKKLCLVAVLLALPLTATAQQPHRRGDDRRSADRGSDKSQHANASRQDSMGTTRTSTAPAPPPPAAPGNTGLSLPPIGLPPAKSSMPWWEQKQSPWWEHQAPPPWEKQQVPAWQTNNPARTILNRERNQSVVVNNRGRWHDRVPDVVYVLPPYRYFPTTLPGINEHYVSPPPPTTPVMVGTVQAAAAPVGALRLEVEPRDELQVFVDGVFIGTPADHGDDIELSPGVRHIELRARGYRPLTFDAEILPDRLITYRGKLDRDEAASPSTPAATIITPTAMPAKTTMYVIPGCYLGNVEPKPSDLKPGCNIRSMITILP
ncbi:MAG TPA: hypothetical protein VK955_03280 [Xanthobacteraceae bacterium]|nr:hypothetical protein [Xanthobacteraceae bacterium]